MFDIALRSWKDGLFDPLSRAIPTFITPLQITAAAFLCGMQACISACLGNIPMSILFWMLNRVLDCLDGAVARHRKEQSDVGGFLDILGDFIIYSLIPISCALGNSSSNPDTVSNMLAVALLESSFHVNNTILFYVAALMEKFKAQGNEKQTKELTSVVMRPALVEGVESAVFFTLMFLFPSHLQLLSYLMLAGVVFGSVQRVRWVVFTLRRERST